ncbi:MAG: SPOR domain-containing protein [Nevskia sp.]
MARDYAKQRNPNGSGRGGTGRGGAGGGNRRGGSTDSAPGIPGWVWLILGLAIGLAVAAVVYIGRPSNKVTLGSAPLPVAAGTAATAKDEGGRKSSIALPPKQPSRFAFYEMLPSYEVVIPRETGKAAAASGQPPKPAAAAAAEPPPDVKQALAEPGQYLIQVGAYRSRDEADKNRASLALIGVESRIEQVTIDQKDTWYRVRIGPQATLAKAQEILERLEANDIKGMLVKVKS